MATGVARQVHRLHPDTAAEIEHVTVVEPLGIGTRLEVELLDHDLFELAPGRAGEPVHGHQPVDALRADEVGVVDVHPGVGEQPVAGHVVLVAVAVDDRVDGHRRATAGDHRDRRIDDDRLAGTAHEHRVARRIRAVVVADEHAHARRQPPLRRTPIDHSNAVRRSSPDSMCFTYSVVPGPISSLAASASTP